ncbi:putative disease resistance protein RGA1 [Abrus precatorius]|uniref:Disease resistance protein RGA1 n=1 Tax=Abrus precatorius TaxID=3816 RepID=A0A8B8K216_ABRPR|nr:putative disease resistance protein RGA1 [Abrus precatorius]
MSHFYFCKLSDRIEELKHLRYLDLIFSLYTDSRRPISFPKSLSNLILLQTLIVGEYDEESFLEVVIKLVNLRCLDKGDVFKGTAVGLGTLSSLQFLPTFVVGDSQKRRYGTLNELKDLNLQGKLEILQLNRVTDVALESQDVNLKEKRFLQSLTLDWYFDYTDIRNSDSLQLLENLQPHHNLKQLEVRYYPGKRFPDWLSLLTNVVHITLFELRNCSCLPPLERLRSLKSLVINCLRKLEYIYLEDGFAVTFFPSLEELILLACPVLRGWRRRGDDINDSKNSHNHSLSLSFPPLSKLRILLCPKLICMPTFPNVKDLDLAGSSVKPLIATLNTAASTCSVDSSSFVAPLCMLKQFHISDSLNLQKGWMQNLTSLESLRIVWCQSETLEGFETGLPDDINCLPSLRQITIESSTNLKALPDWIFNLSSLQHLIIHHYLNLASLPEGMTRLTNLKILQVSHCPLLIEECRSETSAVSRRIAHIPEIILRNF